ncbi:TonB-dependent receptor [Nguyenibacter sp. L1]|uniref:TonB-dependent receptor n=1 Tax=Nguyenibacter sp. L1 TaxID=3049350 RepID=UPI002B48E835|nr:TonB-dependent receptor [Nguyenibacter sp. L1]WRH88780.1 TonB-dependent receptor [Nguyenibacter sp. L1]
MRPTQCLRHQAIHRPASAMRPWTRPTYRTMLLLGISLLAACPDRAVHAATDATKGHPKSHAGATHRKTAAGATPGSPAAAMTRQAGAPGGGIEQITVTSQKRVSTAQKTPISMSVWTGKALQSYGINSISGLSAIAPDVNFLETEGEAVITIRGISSHDTSEIGDPAVAISTDGVYTNRGYSFNSTFYDLDRVEVERGPQGTLSGRNAVGGAINVITAKPTMERAASAKLEFGNYDAVSSWAMINQPISDKVQVRLAFNSGYHDGYRDLGASGRGDGANSISGRATVAFQPFSHFKGLLTYQGTHMGGAGQAVYNVPYQFDAGGNLIHDMPVLPEGNPSHLAIPTTPRQNMSEQAVRWNFDYELPYVTLTYLGGYDSNHFVEVNDSSTDVSYSHQIESWNAHENPKTQNQEFRISSDSRYRFFWTTGFYYFREDNGLQSFDSIPLPQNPAARPLIFNYTTLARSMAWYAHGTFKILPTLRLTGGIRYNWDHKVRAGNIMFPANPVSYPYEYVTIPNYGQGSWDQPTWHAGIEYDITPRNMAYFKVDTGYKPGGFTDLNQYNPENVRAYELGLKNRFWHNHVQFNISGFYENYTGQQVAQIIKNYGGGGQIIDNAGSSTIYGVDPNLILSVPRIGQFDVDFEWLHARFDNFDVAVDNPLADGSSTTVMQQFAGNTLPQAPALSIGAGFSRYWTVPTGRVRTNIRTKFQSSSYFYFTNSADTKQKSYTNTTAFAEYVPDRGHWHAQVFIRNIENARIFVNAAENGYADAYSYSFAPPRTFGGSVSVDF